MEALWDYDKGRDYQSYYDKALTLYGTITRYAIEKSPEECFNILNSAWEMCETARMSQNDISEQKQILDLENRIVDKIEYIERLKK